MKFRLPYLALLIAVPSLVCAGSTANFAKEVRFVSASDNERITYQRLRAYNLVWNSNVGKFEVRSVQKSEPLIIEKFLQQPTPDENNQALAI